MRRAVVTGIVLVAAAGGCGGGSNGSGSHPSAGSRSQGPAAIATPQASDGRLGGAIVARPGTLELHGKVEKITGRSILPPNTKNALGAEENCTGVDAHPTAETLQQISDSIFCLMNAMRANAGVPALRQQAELAHASVEHSQDMADHDYFAHDSQDGRTVVDRLKSATYIPKLGDWVIGENLAWGAGSLASPKALVNAWMNSPPHRENLLSGDFVEVGMGLVFGTPSKDAPDGVTVTTDFGTRPGSAASAAADASTTAPGGSADSAEPGGAGDSSNAGSGEVAGTTAAAAARKKAVARHRRAVAAKRKRALRRCARKHGSAKRRCVRAARRIHR